ncbi:4'-phosphopantetheinyl transferase family protein [Psychroserpens damuponensis]|uniref:4'-phosphopantetheinyl transferase family protein n=1 Tax=Psychroserpens damuponensis TaxID=943936 RepID=UPI0005906763|nr:4'-phosphopantetheinyl transferase superfamily protein [Psychroserpens damuponensis]
MSNIVCQTTQIYQTSYNLLHENSAGLSLFKIKLSSYYDLVPELKLFLNTSEMQRAQKYHFDKDRNQFIICRSLLKFILAKYLKCDVSEIKIEIHINKKPYISSNKNIYFNLSHSKDFAIIALNNSDVGIDIEYLSKDLEFLEMMPSIYSDIEIKTVLNAPNKTHAFYNFWTRKESIVKATGQGISDYLPQIPALEGSHIVDSKLVNGIKSLNVLSFKLNDDYIASLALSNENSNLDALKVYNLPNTIESLKFFSS